MDGPRSRGYGARSGYDVRTRCIRGCTERRQGVSPKRISGMRRRLPASAWDASREALNSSKQREAPPLPPDLLNPGRFSSLRFMMHASGGAKFNFCKLSSNLCYQYVAAFKRYDRNSKNIGQAQPFLRWL